MLVILPDPSTRPCPRHRDELMTDSIPCLRCESERLSAELLERTRQTFAEIFKDYELVPKRKAAVA